MSTRHKILIMGASYGSLLGTKLALAGHAVHLICLPAEADLINKEGAIVRMPVKDAKAWFEINSKKLPGTMTAGGTAGVKPSDYDTGRAGDAGGRQYRSPGRARAARTPWRAPRFPACRSLNMPPLPYLKSAFQDSARTACAAAIPIRSVWDGFDPKVMTAVQPPIAGRSGRRRRR